MNDYFVNITENLGISCANIEDSSNDFNENPCSRIIEHFESHSSILKIKGSISSTIKFSFRKATVEEMLEQLNYLDPKKASPQESIPPKILKANADMFCFPLKLPGIHSLIFSAEENVCHGSWYPEHYYSAVPNNRGVWNNWGGWKIFQKLIIGGIGIIGGWRL